jgi:hypothetical protein
MPSSNNTTNNSVKESVAALSKNRTFVMDKMLGNKCTRANMQARGLQV